MTTHLCTVCEKEPAKYGRRIGEEWDERCWDCMLSELVTDNLVDDDGSRFIEATEYIVKRLRESQRKQQQVERSGVN